jgi:hypothetical protein
MSGDQCDGYETFRNDFNGGILHGLRSARAALAAPTHPPPSSTFACLILTMSFLERTQSLSLSSGVWVGTVVRGARAGRASTSR